jgi:hypothetical protein
MEWLPSNGSRVSTLYESRFKVTADYGYWDYLDGTPVRRALGEIKLKSL